MKDAPPECHAAPAPWSLAAGSQKTARDRILTAASFLFCNRGFTATGIDTVLARAGTAKATLYKHFESKDVLIRAVLEAEGAAWRRWFFGRLAATDGPAEARLLAVFDVLGEWLGDPGFYGCPFINAVAEFDTDNLEVRAIAEAHKAHLVTWLKAQALELGVNDATDLARRFAVLIDGAIVAAQNAHDPSFAQTAKSLARDYLTALQKVPAPAA